MARIRSLKPEAFESETLAKVSVDAERTLFGLTTIVDDRGRLADKPAQINGNLWSMRGGHTAADLDGELEQLVKADGLLCRYTGCDGKRYIHLVTWDRHQKIDHPSRTRLPRCPHHLVSATGSAEECGLHPGNCPPRESVARAREASSGTQAPSAPLASPPGEPGSTPQASENAATAHDTPDQPKRESSREPREASRGLAPDLGPRTVDLGPRTVQPSAAANKPRPDDAALTITQRSKRITDTYAEAEPMCKWPAVNGVVIKAIKSGRFTDDEITAALLRMAGENRSVTVDSLRTELGGLPAQGRGAANGQRPSTADQRVAEAQALKERRRQRREQGDVQGGLPPNTIPGEVVQ